MSRYAIGIDLGTTHCAIARTALDGDGTTTEVLEIPQLVAAGELAEQRLLPSFIYISPEAEGPQAVPWDSGREVAVGAYARARAAEVPGRVVASAKSWLCHPSLDRRAGVLPLAAPAEVEKVSPVEASFRYLEHLVEAYDDRYASDGGSLTEQKVIITVPASFDAAARELTVEAALAAGIEDLTLLEEPQAAVYAWLEQAGEAWRGQLSPGDVVLVVDIGGGTSDFSAIAVQERDGNLALERIAVGDHILLGGDNMDLALAYSVKQRLEEEGTTLDSWQMGALTHAAREAKEKLLGQAGAASVPVVVPRRGSKLVGGAIRTEVTRDELRKLVLDGFFPQVAADARPAQRRRAGLTQVGLPYAQDAGVTRHLASFLGRQAEAAGQEALLRPTAVLFNGGVMRSELLRERLRGTLDAWMESLGGSAVRTLTGGDLDLAVARGAARYGYAAETGSGVRIRGGTARAHYVGIESAVPAVPGLEPPITLMCVAPFGMEEGTAVDLPAHQLAVVVGEPVRFRFFGSSVRRHDEAGTTFERYPAGEIDELPPIEVTLTAEDRTEGDLVPVYLHAQITPVGTLQLDAVPTEPKRDDERWKVELSVRDAGPDDAGPDDAGPDDAGAEA